MSAVVRIDRLGSDGDGEVVSGQGRMFVPFTLPGERVRVEPHGPRGRLLEILEPSRARTEPACRHFGRCGGCALQHAGGDAYRRFKVERVERALAVQGIEAHLDPLISCPPASRRRLIFSARIVGGIAVVGFNEPRSHRIMAVEACPVALPEIEATLPGLRQLAKIAGTASRITVTWTASGADVDLSAARPPDAAARRAMTSLAIERDFARLSVDREILIELRPPVVMVGRVALTLQPAAFLQAVEQAERAMAGLVAEYLKDCRAISDLYAGSGAFALRLAERCLVHAVEGDPVSLAALDRAVRGTPGLRSVTSETRDLERRPLTSTELARFDGVVFDPPRAGAPNQSRQLAQSAVGRIAAVSCNPVTLARDLAILLEGGYRIDRVTPIDQFLWSPHVEVVALLSRDRGGGRRQRNPASAGRRPKDGGAASRGG